ncbi:MAG: hypothetical protein JWL83_1649 [Actinomycetia bacterium]|nr:hypothetical protein [Actinomycetes bacterium]
MVDEGTTANVAVELTSMQTNMTKAWDAAVYVIEHAPPPVAASGAVPFTGGQAPTASPEETGFAVLGLQHDVVNGLLSVIDTAGPTLLTPINTAITAAVDARDKAVAYIHAIPPPPVAGSGGVRANAGGAPIAAGWDTLMPGLVPLLDDEIQQARATPPSDPTVTPKLLTLVKQRDRKTKKTVNTFWPPVPAG